MVSSPPTFTLSNVPYVNARFELRFLLDELETPAFARTFHAGKVVMPFGSWEGQPHELASDLMRRSIIGIESYVVGAVRITAINASRWSEALENKLRDPFRLKGRGAIDNYYNKVPELLSPAYSLKNANQQLWTELGTFYRSTRNPLFHGFMISELEIPQLLSAHLLIGRVYSWIDSWSTY